MIQVLLTNTSGLKTELCRTSLVTFTQFEKALQTRVLCPLQLNFCLEKFRSTKGVPLFCLPLNQAFLFFFFFQSPVACGEQCQMLLADEEHHPLTHFFFPMIVLTLAEKSKRFIMYDIFALSLC